MTAQFSDRQVDKLRVLVFEQTAAMARTAARLTAEAIRSAVAAKGTARIAIATGNSQLAMVAALRDEPDVPWHAVTVFHLDEYVDLSPDHPASFRRWIRERIEEPLRPAMMHYINGNAADPEPECQRYESLLRAAPLDVTCMGIGENGHIAFNEPGFADFADQRWVRVVELDDRSRAQQVGEGHFPSIADTALRAYTLTVPALLSARTIHVVVPESRKAQAVRACLTDGVSTDCPATILRHQGNAVLFLDKDSAALLDD